MAKSQPVGLGRLSGRVAIVTGGASPRGFGYAIAQRYLAEGCHVLLCDIHRSLGATAKQLAGDTKSTSQVQALEAMDVTSRECWDSAVKTCLDTWGRLDIIVNNAGKTYTNKSSLEVSAEDFASVMNVNVTSVYNSVIAGLPAIKKGGRGGSIINVSSTGAIRPRPGLVWYNASKAAVSNATKGLAAEFGPDGIRVNAICPLLSATALFSEFVGVEDTEENRKKFAESIPLQRLTEPIDVANAAVFLASDEGRFITGTNFEVDGGRCI